MLLEKGDRDGSSIYFKWKKPYSFEFELKILWTHGVIYLKTEKEISTSVHWRDQEITNCPVATRLPSA